MPYKTPKSDHAKAMARERHRRWREKNRDVLRERSAQFQRDNPEYAPTYRKEHKEEYRLYVESKRDAINARRRAWYAARRQRRRENTLT